MASISIPTKRIWLASSAGIAAVATLASSNVMGSNPKGPRHAYGVGLGPLGNVDLHQAENQKGMDF
jgi:hypothetical protein